MKDNNIKQALKGTSIIAGAQVFQIVFGVIRTKIIAILLGPSGVGISGLYQSVMQLTISLFSLGISQSIVKSVAASDDNLKRARLINSSILLTCILGLFAITVSITFAKQISIYTFDTSEYAFGVAVLSISVLANMVFANLTGIVQGLRQLKKIATINIYSSVAGLFVSVPVYYFLGVKGIVMALILISLSNLAISIFVVKLEIKFSFPTLDGFKHDAIDLMKLGIALALSGIFIALSGYFIRIYVTEMQGIAGVGFLNAATAISTLYLSLIFTAMGTDFYPKLASVSSDNNQVNKNVNDQILISLLVAGPIIVAFIFFSDTIIEILYSNKFASATPLLQWQLLGTLVKTFSWPIGFIFLAKGLSKFFIFTEIVFNLSYYLFTIILWKHFQITSIGISFFLSYVLYTLIIVLAAKQKSGYNIQRDVISIALVFLFSSGIIILISSLINNVLVKNTTSIVLILLSSAYSYFQLKRLISFREIYDKLISKLKSR